MRINGEEKLLKSKNRIFQNLEVKTLRISANMMVYSQEGIIH